MTITVKWGRERLHIPYPDPRTTLGQIRKAIAEYTHLPGDSLKLIHSGGVMKDDSQPITAYGLKSGSSITVIGGSTDFPGSKTSQPPPRPTESSLIATIEGELSRVRSTLLQPLDVFTNAISAAQIPREDLKQEHTRIGEMLLQSLLKLDAIVPESEWEQARLQRKAAVKEVQALLDRLDNSWRSTA